MVFSSPVFLFLFLPIVFIFYFYFPKKETGIKNLILLIASLAFYVWGEPIFIFIMLFSIFINWILSIYMNEEIKSKKNKIIVIIATIYNILILFIFKYLTFTSKIIAEIANNNSLIINITLPIGISFFTFQIMSYIFDIYYGKVKPQKNILNLTLYVSLFPQLIAGPIVRYETIANEIENRKETSTDFSEGMIRFVCGLGKKVILSNYLAIIADNIFSMSGDISICTSWLGAICYTLQIYFDFSGYSDMAIGLGRIFGFHFDENFNYPYISKSITEFWRRWHISLSSWFRDYIYIPLGGNRCSKSRHIFNLFIVWLLTGIWHGANWTFIIWGLFYFILLVLEKEIKFTSKLKGFGHVYTMFFVILAWVIFRADSINSAFIYISNMFGASGKLIDKAFLTYIKNGALQLIIISCILSTPIFKYIKEKNKISQKTLDLIKGTSTVVLFIITLILAVKSTYNPFIYFNF